MSEAWRLQRALLLRKLARMKADIAALRSEVALLRMQTTGEHFKRRVAAIAMLGMDLPPPPLSEEDDPPIS